MTVPEEKEWTLSDKDILVFVKRASGAGGQHVNVTDSCVVMRHIPTSIETKASSRCQHNNRKVARELLESRVKKFYIEQQVSKRNTERLEKRGSGMRGDKVKTYRVQDGIVTNHLTGIKTRLKDILNGISL